ncbi:MAG: DUF72 domain-containing protein [Burkholderiaceae bacterium]
MREVRIGTAGWSIPRARAERCASEGSHLARYARVLSCAEINTSFHRSHRYEVYARWAAQTPSGFRFAVKVPRAITHDQRLRESRALLTDSWQRCPVWATAWAHCSFSYRRP